MDRTAALRTLAVFFGASVAFGLIREATDGESLAVSLGAQAVALVVIVGAVVLVFRERD